MDSRRDNTRNTPTNNTSTNNPTSSYSIMKWLTPYSYTENYSNTTKSRSRSNSGDSTDEFELNDLQISPKPELHYTEEMIGHALQAAEDAKPASFEIIDYPLNEDGKIIIKIGGCGGSQTEHPQLVYNLEKQIAIDNPELTPHFNIVLGDNFYPDGVSSPVDKRFDDFHRYNDMPSFILLGNHDVKRSTETKKLYDPLSYLPGAQRIFAINPLKGEDAGKQQVAHAMLPHSSDPKELSQTKPQLFQKKQIPYQLLPNFILPHEDTYASSIGKIHFVFLNTNEFARDYLIYVDNYKNGIQSNPNTNQIAWLIEENETAKKEGKSLIVCTHHPLVCIGKRRYQRGWDGEHYLEPFEITLWMQIHKRWPNGIDFTSKQAIKELNEIFEELPNSTLFHDIDHDEMLYQILYLHLKIYPHMVLSAHEHFTKHYLDKQGLGNKKICEITVGGKGSPDLQQRYYFGEREKIGAYLREHGTTYLAIDPKNPEIIDIYIFTTKKAAEIKEIEERTGVRPHPLKHRLHLTNQSTTPIRQVESDPRVDILRKIVLAACEKYQIFLHEMQTEKNGEFFHLTPPAKEITTNAFLGLFSTEGIKAVKEKLFKTHTKPDIDVMHDMINYFNQEFPSSYNDSVIQLNKMMNRVYNKDYDLDHSFYADINETLRNYFKYDIHELYNNLDPIITLHIDEAELSTRLRI